MICEICGCTDSRTHTAREMMFGLRDAFDYSECFQCGRVRLMNPPVDMSRYYPKNYYSFHFTGSPTLLQALIFKASRLGIRRLRIARMLNLKRSSSVLDVGGGAGQLVFHLRLAGYPHCLSIDPYIEVETPYSLRKTLEATDGRWDYIMFNHSLEHMDDQIRQLTLARERLAPGGLCLVCVPIISEAWKRYGTDWVQLDCPRHVCLHTPNSLRLMARHAGFCVIKTVYDSTGLQFWGSEMYRAGIPLIAGPRFSRRQMKQFEKQAKLLNRREIGDQAAFVLAVSQA